MGASSVYSGPGIFLRLLLHCCDLEPLRQSLVLCALWPVRAWEPLAGCSLVLTTPHFLL